MKGTIVAFDAYRGWGFIQGNGKKYFFHVKNSPDFNPVLGSEVAFETAAPFAVGKQDQAVNLRKVEGADGAAA